MVIDDIRSNIRELYPTWNCDVKETATLRYGKIEHLCTSIELHCGEKGSITVGKVAKALHPTAAVCGLPRDIAVKNIDRLEQFDRRFYAGLISTADTAYVILRCVHFDSNHWCIYSGSGITGQSVADDEWAETQAKSRTSNLPSQQILSTLMPDNNDSSSRHLLTVVVYTFGLLLLMSAIPWGRLTNNSLKDFNLFEDLFPTAANIAVTTTSAIVDPELEELMSNSGEQSTPENSNTSQGVVSDTISADTVVELPAQISEGSDYRRLSGYREL